MNYKTLTYITSNENGEHEVEIVYERSLWRWLFRMAERKETFVANNPRGTWYCKWTGLQADRAKREELCYIATKMS